MNHQDYLLFPTLVMAFDLTGDVDNKQMIDNYKGVDHLLMDGGSSNYDGGGWNMDSYPGLKNTLQQCVDIYAERMNLSDMTISNSWMNSMTPGSKVKPHRHEGSVVSGAYYPKVADGSASLIFHSPISLYRMNDVFKGESELNTYFNYFPARENVLYIFPSWLTHETEVNDTEERYVLSFNTGRTY
jgi:uncharacterized protein (TIGR02466 family)